MTICNIAICLQQKNAILSKLMHKLQNCKICKAVFRKAYIRTNPSFYKLINNIILYTYSYLNHYSIFSTANLAILQFGGF